MPSLSRTATLFLISVLVAATCFPQAAGRLMLEVVDQDGEGLPGVTVTVTSAELSSFEESSTTNKRGIVSFIFQDATRTYDVRLEKEGYQPTQVQLKPEVGGVAREEVPLYPVGTAAPQAPATATEGKVRFSPAEEAFNAGVLALRADDTETARQRFEEALAADPDLVGARSGLAGIYLAEKQYQAAAEAASSVVAATPEDPRAWRILYEAHRGLGQDDEAAKALERLRELGQGEEAAPMLYNEAIDAVRLGDRETARRRLREALEIDPDLTAAQDVLAALLLEEGEHAEAAAMAERVLAQDPRHERALTVRYEAYRRLGDEAKAQAALAALIEVKPQAMAAQWIEQGVQRFEAGDVGGASELFRRVLEAQPEHADAHYRLALCQISQGQSDEAREHLQRFLALAPDHPEAATAREMLEFLQ